MPHILVFCRAPIPGKVKTRLIPHLREEGAAKLHEELAERMIETALAANFATVELWCEPDTRHDFFRQFDCEKHIQKGADLGERMAKALDNCLKRRARSAVLIGTDCPNLDIPYLKAAINSLADHDAVIGPAEDGGYGLIGLNEANAGVFSDIDWGTSRVCAETCRRLNHQRLNWRLLPLLWDVDREQDLSRYRRFLKRR